MNQAILFSWPSKFKFKKKEKTKKLIWILSTTLYFKNKKEENYKLWIIQFMNVNSILMCVSIPTHICMYKYIYIHIISIKNNTKGSQVVSQLAFKVELWNN